MTGDMVRLTAVGGQLILSRGSALGLTLPGNDSFQNADGYLLHFARKANGAAAFSLTCGVAPQLRHRVPCRRRDRVR